MALGFLPGFDVGGGHAHDGLKGAVDGAGGAIAEEHACLGVDALDDEQAVEQAGALDEREGLTGGGHGLQHGDGEPAAGYGGQQTGGQSDGFVIRTDELAGRAHAHAAVAGVAPGHFVL